MRITKMRDKDGQMLSSDTMLTIERELKYQFKRNGFITGVSALSRISMKVGLNMRSFSIDVAMLGYNQDRSYNGRNTKLGFKRTNLPTWEQRVSFNRIINDVLDSHGIKANIKSGA